jgi:hypothetical protein
MSAVGSTVRTEREKALETARGLKAKADHPSTPGHEAATCRKMLDSLVRKWGFSNAELETHTEDDDWAPDWEERVRRDFQKKKAQKEKEERERRERSPTFEEQWEDWAAKFYSDRKNNYVDVLNAILNLAEFDEKSNDHGAHLIVLAKRCMEIAIEEFRVAKVIPDAFKIRDVALDRFAKLKEVREIQQGAKFVGIDGRVVEPSKLTDLELGAMLHRYAQEIRNDWINELHRTEKYGKEDSFRRFLSGLLTERAKATDHKKGAALANGYRLLHAEIRRRELKIKG